MHFFKEIFYWRGNVWKWWLMTFLPALLPFLVSIIVAATKGANVNDYVKLNDLIFMGLSMNISNLGVWSTGLPVEKKEEVTFYSISCLIALTICITIAHLEIVDFVSLAVLSTGFVLLSLITSIRLNIALNRLPKRKTK